MSRHDEPNEYGFAGEGTAPEPTKRERPDPRAAAEEIAIPGDDVTDELSEALADDHDGRNEDEDPDVGPR
ncbi:hypothetical protein [Micromonospora zhanjiangensis]|uniref:Uncharacterized protein n=1 Tax=Micromonospora zhanjiangensis TaxID=1522057 RepID=A0ABV8KR15_9ACTN